MSISIKTFLFLLFFLSISVIGFAQKKKTFYARIYSSKSTKTRGRILAVTDTSLTSIWNGKTQKWNTSAIRRIEIYRIKKFPISAIPIYIGLGHIIASPFQGNWNEGQTAANGLGLIVAGTIGEVLLRKRFEKITVSEERHLKERLSKYIYTKADTAKVQ